MATKVVVINGSYRKGRTVDQAVDEIVKGAKAKGAEVKVVFLRDKNIKYCANCRSCTRTAKGVRGLCGQKDDMNSILNEVDAADSLVLAAPVNHYNVTALMRCFIERTICYSYWPWGVKTGPKLREEKPKQKRAVLVTATAAPSFMGRLTTGAIRILKILAKVFNAKVVGTMFVGLTAVEEKQALTAREVKKAQALGANLA